LYHGSVKDETMAHTTREDDASPEPMPDGSVAPPARPMHLRAVEERAISERPKTRRRRKVTASKDAAGFFELPQAHSLVKATIVSKYFKSWAGIIKPRATEKKMAYFDLFAGKGAYDDGTPSTPLLIMNTIIADPVLREQMLTFFADALPECIKALRENVAALPGIGTLKYAPKIETTTPKESKLDETFAAANVIPSFMFLDPFGYEGVTANLINAILKSWGCDVVFFFCFKRMPGAIMNNKVRDHMDALFGAERVDELRKRLPTLKREQKEEAILAALEASLNVPGKRYVQTFRFRDSHGNVSHHLVFVTKNPTAHKIMKGIMGHESSSFVEDVPSFEYMVNAPQKLFETYSPIEELIDDLVKRFRGRTVTIEQIIAEHHYGTRYVDKNYQEALRRLCYDRGAVTAVRGPMSPTLNPKKRDMPLKNTFITFP